MITTRHLETRKTMTETPDSPRDDAAKGETPKGRGGGKKGRSGPPRGNDNAARHYLRAGKLPPHLQYAEHRSNSLRRHLEEAVAKVKGEVSMIDAAAINSAVKWERHGILVQHYIRHKEEELTVDQLVRFSAEIAKASDNRDKNLRTLGLDVETKPFYIMDVPSNGRPPEDT